MDSKKSGEVLVTFYVAAPAPVLQLQCTRTYLKQFQKNFFVPIYLWLSISALHQFVSFYSVNYSSLDLDNTDLKGKELWMQSSIGCSSVVSSDVMP